MKSFENNIFYQENQWGGLILWQNKSATKKQNTFRTMRQAS